MDTPLCTVLHDGNDRTSPADTFSFLDDENVSIILGVRKKKL